MVAPESQWKCRSTKDCPSSFPNNQHMLAKCNQTISDLFWVKSWNLMAEYLWWLLNESHESSMQLKSGSISIAQRLRKNSSCAVTEC